MLRIVQNHDDLTITDIENKAAVYPEWQLATVFTGNCDTEKGDVEKHDDFVSLLAAAPEFLQALKQAEQTIRNLGNGSLTGDSKEIALNEAANIRAAIAKAKG